MVKSNTNDTEILLDYPYFCLYRCDRSRRRDDDVPTGVKWDIVCTGSTIDSQFEALLVRSQCSNVTLGVCYSAPVASPNFVSNFHDGLATLSARYSQTQFSYLVTLTTRRYIGAPPAPTALVVLGMLKNVDFCLTFNQTQIISFSTRITDSNFNILDFAVICNPGFVSSLLHLDGVSDHMALYCSLAIAQFQLRGMHI